MAPKDESPDGVNLSRRHFLKSTGVVGLAASVVAPADTAAQGGPAALGPGEVPVRLNVNGRQLSLTIEPRVTLLDALRMRADLTGNKRGCDRGGPSNGARQECHLRIGSRRCDGRRLRQFRDTRRGRGRDTAPPRRQPGALRNGQRLVCRQPCAAQQRGPLSNSVCRPQFGRVDRDARWV